MQQDSGTEPARPGPHAPELSASPESPRRLADNRLFVLVLQHPQERSEPRATAAMTVASLRRARLAVGLSWPNLARALGNSPEDKSNRSTDPRRWGVLYLGSTRPVPLPGPQDPARPDAGPILVLDRDGAPVPGAAQVLRGLEGIVLLDGTWSQAKTLWWRNPWLLKLHRLVLNPPQPARLGALRREPRPEALSTLEAAALVLRRVEPGPEPADALIDALDRLIAACGGPRGDARGDAIGHAAADPPNRRSPARGSRFSPHPARYRGRSAAG